MKLGIDQWGGEVGGWGGVDIEFTGVEEGCNRKRSFRAPGV